MITLNAGDRVEVHSNKEGDDRWQIGIISDIRLDSKKVLVSSGNRNDDERVWPIDSLWIIIKSAGSLLKENEFERCG